MARFGHSPSPFAALGVLAALALVVVAWLAGGRARPGTPRTEQAGGPQSVGDEASEEDEILFAELGRGEYGILAGRIVAPAEWGTPSLHSAPAGGDRTWGSGRPFHASTWSADGTGIVVKEALDPGVRSLWLDFECREHALLLVPEIEIAPGKVSRPAALDPLDLRAVVRIASVTVVDAAGAPIPGVEIERFDRWTRPDGTVRIPHCGVVHPFTTRCFGWKAARGELRAGPQRIVLERGPRVRLRLSPDSAGTPEDLSLGTTLVTRAGRAAGGIHRLDRGWTDALPLTSPGIYHVTWSLRRDGTKPRFLGDSDLATAWVDVKDVSEVQEFTLAFPEERMRDALAELAK